MFSKGNKTSSRDSFGDSSKSSSVTTAEAAAPSIISADLKIVGNLASAGDLQIDGTVEGDITSRRLTVGEGALVQGAILADSVKIYGSVSGEIKANSVHLAKSARVDGDIGHQSIAMEAGASVSGRLTRLEKPVAGATTSGATTASSSSSGVSGSASQSGSSASSSYSSYQS
jgi:cytoskeletal protein CcmA (bactofilin family)